MKSTSVRAILAAALMAASLSSIASPASAMEGYGYVKTADAAPTPRQIEDAIRAQNYTQAETMLNQVLQAKPDSAKAWYWMAQTQEKLGNTGRANEALSKAEQLQPNLKFASPGAVASMHSRLGHTGVARQETPRQLPQPQTQPIPGYDSRPGVGATSTSVAVSPSGAVAPAQHSSHAWVFVMILLAIGGGGAWFYFNKRSKNAAEDAKDRERKGLLGRANAVQERATALSKTARFEGQESSAFGVAAAGLLSRANSALGRLKGFTATFDSAQERRGLDAMEADLERLENQGARKAWTEEAPQSAPAAVSNFASQPDPMAQGSAYASQPQSYPQQPSYPQQGGYPQNGGYPQQGFPQQGPTTVVVNGGNNSSGLLETMLVADVLSHNHHDRDREYDLERDNQRLRDQQRSAPSAPAYAPDPAPAPSSFDLGGGSSDSWDSGSSSAPAPDNSSWDSGSSSSSDSSSSWDSGSSSDSSSSDSSSSSSDDSSW